jgi:hypothetical protein
MLRGDHTRYSLFLRKRTLRIASFVKRLDHRWIVQRRDGATRPASFIPADEDCDDRRAD